MFCQRDESDLIAGILLSNASDYDSGHHHGSDLGVQSFMVPGCVSTRASLFALGLYFDVCERRASSGFFPGSAFDRHHASCDVFRGGAFSTW